MVVNKNKSAVFNIKFHLVWCTKYRLAVLVDNVENRMKELLNEKASGLNIVIETFEIMPDHVHLFLTCKTSEISPNKIAAQFKGYTSHVLRKEFKQLTTRMPTLWSRSYYIGTIGHISDDTVRKYIENQKKR